MASILAHILKLKYISKNVSPYNYKYRKSLMIFYNEIRTCNYENMLNILTGAHQDS